MLMLLYFASMFEKLTSGKRVTISLLGFLTMHMKETADSLLQG